MKKVFFVGWLLLNLIILKKVIFVAVEKVTKSCPQIEFVSRVIFFLLSPKYLFNFVFDFFDLISNTPQISVLLNCLPPSSNLKNQFRKRQLDSTAQQTR